MTGIDTLLADNLDLWTSAIARKSAGGRGRSRKFRLHGIDKLRSLILDLAVRGKLVPQDPEDEPASELLKRINPLSGKATKFRQNPLDKRDVPFEIPPTWLWARLGDTCILENGDRGKNYPNKSALTATGVPFVNAGHLQDGRIDVENITYIPDALFNRLGSGKFKVGDILFCLRGSLGKAALVTGVSMGAIASSLVIVRFSEFVDAKYGLMYFASPLAVQMVRRYDNGTAQPNLSSRDLGKFLLPLPPLAEQRRIVAKVEELMALCDRLEAGTYEAIDAHQFLVTELLTTLTASRDTAELAGNWARIETHFDTLLITEDSVDQLKQTILELAVMGRLVPQDSNHEPASELLKRIRAEKAELTKKGQAKKSKLLSSPDQTKPFALPPGWAWSSFSELSLGEEAGWSPQCEPYPKTGSSWGVLKVSAVSWGEFRPEENKALPDSVQPRAELQVAPNDFLISRANTSELVARSVVVGMEVEGRLIISDKIVRIFFTKNVSNQFMNLVNSSAYARQYYAGVAGGTSSSMKNVSRSQIGSLLVPLPPKPEQDKIVKKYNVLCESCDALKRQLATAMQGQLALADAIVAKAVE
ncbi:restriction endonuclease subunit S [Rhizobium sp. WYCCWR 11290]|uniref:Restriction endonuclease subunit S n=1 Tax=Rhizobium changzhiense TaxID=2692317 RepID=A0A7Z0UAR4_9HYPH|nr:restriction endonuclease subunit S [Rhizobium changzhiense]NZD60208.1 restriction endonuclease subunit S [Rhizobium changzhiense]